MYTLPDDAPKQLVQMLERWQDISKRRLPAQDDFAFDDLVGEHPGLMSVEPIWTDGVLTDFILVRVGPEHHEKIGRSIEGLTLAKIYNSLPRRRIMSAYSNTFETGEPHYWEIINSVFGAPPYQYVRLLLPLYNDKGDATSLLANCVWADSPVK